MHTKYLAVLAVVAAILLAYAARAEEGFCTDLSAGTALISLVKFWNENSSTVTDRIMLGSSFHIESVTMKPNSEGRQGVQTNIVRIKVVFGPSGITKTFAAEVDVQKRYLHGGLVDCSVQSVRPGPPEVPAVE
jgi:hypothetical protein